MASEPITRRSLLKGLAVIAGSLAIAHPQAMFAKQKGIEVGSAYNITVGLLMSHSLDKQHAFLQGLQSSNIRFETTTLQHTTDIASTLPSFLATRQPDIMVALVSPQRALYLESFFNGLPLLLMRAGLGAQLSVNTPDWLIEHSLPLWQAAWATGYQAATSCSHILGLQSLAESGYAMSFAAQCGYEAAGGTWVTTHTTSTADQIKHILDRGVADGVSGLYIGYTGTDLDLFSTIWSSHAARKRMRLFGTPVIVHDMKRAGLTDITLATSWTSETSATSQTALWSMLGKDVGVLLHTATAQLGSNWHDRERVKMALQSAQHRTLGGASTLAAAPTTYTLQRFQGTPQRLFTSERYQINAAPQKDRSLSAYTQGLQTGWTNEYGTI